MHADGPAPTMRRRPKQAARARFEDEEHDMGIEDLKGKASDALDSDRGEKASDAALDKADHAASSATGGSHDEQIDKARSSADEHVGNA